MGAALGCCGGPSTDYDLVFAKTARYHPLLGRCDAVEKSLLRKLQRSLSTSWSARGPTLEALRSPHGISHTGSRYGLDEHYESESDTEDPSGGDSSASATSGSRLLGDFYNLVLECDHSKFFVDAQGRPVKGAYLNEIEILEDYFDTTRRTTVGNRRRRRSSVDVLPYQPPQKLQHLGALHGYYDRSSNMSLMSNDTSQTLASESDYWATFMDAPDDVGSNTLGEYVNSLELTFPPRYPAQPLRSRRDSADHRRSWVLQDLQLYATSQAETSPLQLFSPVNTNATTPKKDATRPRSASRNASLRGAASPADKPFVMPIEGSRYNLWGAEEATKASGLVVPSAFSTASVTERRRASLTMGSTSNGTNGASRRLSLHAVAV